MATNEVITISSDEESGCVNRSELMQNKPSHKSAKHFQIKTQAFGRPRHIIISKSKSIQENIKRNFHEIYHKPLGTAESKKDDVIIINENKSKENFIIDKTPEVVVLEDWNNVTKINKNCDIKPNNCVSSFKNHSGTNTKELKNNVVKLHQNVEITVSRQSNSNVCVIPLKELIKMESLKIKKKETSGGGDEIPDFFDKFVQLCSSFEKNKNDRARLIKKMHKRCHAADPKYVNSQEFRTLVSESKEKINKNNLYLIAKEVTDELSLRKKIEIKNTQNSEEVTNEKGQAFPEEEKKSKKKVKMINKIMKKLDQLGMKIRELEEAEVDLSDEEDSSYILVQRYRERFCQIYKKLCELTNEPSDANRVFCRKICFSGSKYPAINQCIEKWLNKTKRFPDFNDIVKLLESQSSSLGLPSNKESIRATATEIFQEVGKMLQRRRKHDLWDSLCGFLDDDKDPATIDPDLDKVLKANFDTRVKKEQEIFRHYAELQESERLEPEEVPEEEANLSPNESGNEDEEEIEGIEKSLNERLDVTIEREHNLEESDYKWDVGEKNVTEGEESFPQNTNPFLRVKEAETSTSVKESKNNFKNCKSIKYRGENRSKSNDDSSSIKDGFEETNEKDGDDNLNKNLDDEEIETKEAVKTAETSPEGGVVTDNENSDVDIVSIGSNETEAEYSELDKFDFSKVPIVKLTRLPDDLDLNNIKVSGNVWMSPKSDKREMTFDDETSASVKKRKMDSQILNLDFKNDVEEVFEVHRCEVEHDYVHDIFNFPDDFSEKRKHWDKGKVFRDLTNVGRLMELNGRKRKSSGYFSHSIYRPDFPEFGKFSWKKRFRLNYKFVGLKDQKCALSQDDKDTKSVGGDGKDSDGKGVENNSESGGDDGSNFFLGGGSGSEKDNDENDENKGGEKTKDFSNDAKHDEDEDEEDEEETEDEMGGKDGKKPEEETPIEDSFNCLTEDKTGSFNESKTTMEGICDRTTTVEEGEVEDNGERETKSDENGENFLENKAGEPEGSILSENEAMSPTKPEEDGYEEVHEQSEKSGEPDIQVDDEKVNDCDIEEESNEMGQAEVGINDLGEEEEEDLETEEQEEKEVDVEVEEEDGKVEGEETGEEVGDSQEKQNEEEIAEIEEGRGNDEDVEAREEQDIDVNVDSVEDEEEGKMEGNSETGGQKEKNINADSVTKEKNLESVEEQDIDINVDSIEEEEEKKEGNSRTGGQQETDVSVDSIEEVQMEKNSKIGEVQVGDEKQEMSKGKDEDQKSKESIEQKEAESASKKEKPLIRLRSLAEMEARIESRMNPRMVPRFEPRIDSRIETRLESRFGLRMEPRVHQRLEPRVEQRLQARIEPRVEQRLQARIEPRLEQRLQARIEPRMEQRLEPRMKPRIEPRMEPRPGLIIDPRGQLRLEPRAGLRLEPRGVLRLEPGGGLRLEPRIGPRMEPRAGLRIEPRAELRAGMVVEPRAELRTGMVVEPRSELRPGLGIEQRIETRIEQRFERLPLGCKNKRENVVRREISQINQGNQGNQTVQTIQAMSTVQTIQRKLSVQEESSYHGGQDSEVEFLGQKIGKRRKTTKSPTDEERVKKFLMHSPSSISIIPPKKLSLSKPPSQAALQALETLKGLKGISATRVRSKESKPEEDVVVIGESYSRPQTARKSTGGVKRRSDLPVISSVHSIQTPSATGSPKIQGFQGNVSVFPASIVPTTTMSLVTAAAAAAATNNRMKNGPPAQPSSNDSSSIRISSVWGSMPQTMVYSRNMPTSGNSESQIPGCSSAGGGEGGSATKKKKKSVEFVVLE